MTTEHAIDILTKMNEWRRGLADCMPYGPDEFGQAIDYAIRKLKEHDNRRATEED